MVDILLKRYLWLVKILKDRGEMTYEDISSAWECSSLNDNDSVLSKRSLYNHCQAVLKHFGVEITCRRGRNLNLYYISNPEIFDSEDINAWLLENFTISSILAESRSVSDRILLEPVPSGQQFLIDVIHALKSNSVISITYRSFNNDREHVFMIEPYCVKMFRQRWYVIGRNIKYDEIRVYALDRVHGIDITGTIFNIPGSFDAQEYFENCFGIIADRKIKPEKVRIRVSGHQRDYFYSLPLHHTQTEVLKTGDYSIFEYCVRPTFDFQKELLSYGSEIEVLEPVSLRQRMADSVKRLSDMYC